MHICNITIPSLPFTLMGHIVLEMKKASLLGIRILCKADCKVIFNDKKNAKSFLTTKLFLLATRIHCATYGLYQLARRSNGPPPD
jgi:hypothetical protein